MASSSSSEDFFAEWDYEESVFNALIEKKRQMEEESSSRRTRAPPRNRNRETGHQLLVRDYFAEDHLFSDFEFKRRFRMSKRLFERIAYDLQERYPFFQQRNDAVQAAGFSTLQQVAAAVCLLGFGNSADSVDYYIRMSERTARVCLYEFCDKLYEVYKPVYLRKPNANDIRQLYEFHETKHGLLGMIGSLDCMHWEWENCPNAYRGAYTTGDHGVPTVVLEAVASHDLWIWHAFFGVARSHNDITVIRQSDLLTDIFTGRATDSSFEVNGTYYPHGYYLTNGIYLEWSTLVKAFPNPEDEKRKLFTKAQEAARKDVERAFSKLKKKWHVLKRPSRSWHTTELTKVMYVCVILNNMITEDTGKAICTYEEDEAPPGAQVVAPGSAVYLLRIADVQNSLKHHNLRHDLMEHVWANRRNED